MSTNFAKTLFWKHEYDVKLQRHKERTPNANDHHMPLYENPHENFLRTPLNYAHKEYVCTLFEKFSNQPWWELHEIVKKTTWKKCIVKKAFFSKML